MTARTPGRGIVRRHLGEVRRFRGAVATIMVKELRSRMRGRRPFVVVTIYLAVLAATTYGIYVTTYSRAASLQDFASGMPMATSVNVSAAIGQSIFAGLSRLQILLVCFMAPAFTAGAISLEREKQTLDLLISTPLRPGAIVVGKLIAALSFVFLVIVAAIPLTAIVLMYGGAGLNDVLRQQAVLFTAALALGSVGIFFSALVKRTQVATVLTYSTVLALFVIWAVASTRPSDPTARVVRLPDGVMSLNPFGAMADVIAYTGRPGIDPFAAAVAGFSGKGEMLCDETGCFEVIGPPPPADIDPSAFALPEPGLATQSRHVWSEFVVASVAISVLLTLLSMQLVVPAGMRFAFRRARRRRDAEGIEEGAP